MQSPPVLFIFFSRPDCVARTFAAIRAAQPSRLYLATDAPRPDVPADAVGCAAARALIENGIDWPCTVQRNYASANLGPDRRIVSAITWFFAQENEGIVFEEDCVPDVTFFPFCAELLARYRDDPRVGLISGNQFVRAGWRCRDGASYAFARLSQIWGWASWRRAWLLHDPAMARWPALRDTPWLDPLFRRRRDRRYWHDRFEECHRGRKVWDYRWTFARWAAGQSGIVPAQNLVSYIGFRDDALHTRGEHPAAAVALRPVKFPLRHPAQFVVDQRLDIATSKILFNTGSLWARATFRLRQIFARLGGAAP